MQRDETATVVGESILITGELSGNEDMTVLGRVEGSIRLAKTLFVATDGIVKADVNVGNAVISGIVIGNVTASESVQITETGRLVGDLVAPRVVIVAGARVRGQVDMSGEQHGASRQVQASARRPSAQGQTTGQAQSQAERDAQSLALARAPSGRFARLGLPQRRPIPVPSTTVRRTHEAAARPSARDEAPSRSSKSSSRESAHAHASAPSPRRSSSAGASKRRSSSRRRD